MAAVTLSLHVISIVAGKGLHTYFNVALGADFLAFYTGGNFFNEGILEQIYDIGYIHKGYTIPPEVYFPNQFSFQRDLIGPDFTNHSPFINPPYAALLYAPFALLDYVPAYLLWIFFNLFLLFVSTRLIRQELSQLQKIPLYKLYLCCFLFFPTIACFLYGQATPIILLLYSLCYISLRKGNDLTAGFCLGLLAFKPQLAVGIALILILKWRWKSLIGGMLSVSLTLGIGLVFMPTEMQAYLLISSKLLDFLRSTDYPTWGIDSYFGFSVLLFDFISPILANIVTITLSIGTLILLFFLWHKNTWLEDKRIWDISMAITFCWGILISPHLFYYDLMLLLLPVAIVIQHLPWIYERNNKILLWTTILWIITYLGSQMSSSQLKILSYFHLPEVAFQLITPFVFYWGYTVYKLVQIEHDHSKTSS